MESTTLKAYISRAKELEVAIFTQKKLMVEHQKVLFNERPQPPTKNIPPIPSNIKKPSIPAENPSTIWRNIAIGVVAFFVILQIYASAQGGHWISSAIPSGMVTISLFLIAIAVLENRNNKDKYEEQYAQYKSELNSFNKLSSEYEKKKKAVEEEYKEAVNTYNIALENYKKMEASAMVPHNELLSNLENALAAHYEENILFAKYRNLVAVSTIDEYLQSGRCEALVGSDGAYNLYEMELRQNIVIGQLSAILDNMEQIKANQYTLYQELSVANNTINEIISDIRDLKSLSKLNAYFASGSAKASVSPKYIHGHIY